MYKGYVMKIYKIYLTTPEYIFNTRLKYLIDSVDKVNYKIKGNDVVILYAWTPKKKLVKKFLEERCQSVFTVKTQEIDYEEEYDEFASNNQKSKLYEENIALIQGYDSYERETGCKILDTDNFVKMVVTKFEVENFSTYRSENMNEFGPQIKANLNYEYFNDEIKEALTILGYTTLYDSSYSMYYNNGDDASRYERAMAVENMLDSCGDEITGLMRIEYIVFIYLYSYTFIGK